MTLSFRNRLRAIWDLLTKRKSFVLIQAPTEDIINLVAGINLEPEVEITFSGMNRYACDLTLKLIGESINISDLQLMKIEFEEEINNAKQ